MNVNDISKKMVEVSNDIESDINYSDISRNANHQDVLDLIKSVRDRLTNIRIDMEKQYYEEGTAMMSDHPQLIDQIESMQEDIDTLDNTIKKHRMIFVKLGSIGKLPVEFYDMIAECLNIKDSN